MTNLQQFGARFDQTLKQMIRLQSKLIKSLEQKQPAIDSLKLLSKFGAGWNRTDCASQLALGQVFSYFRSSWESLPDQFTSQYEHSFDRFVQELYMISPGRAHSYANDWDALMSGQYVKHLPAGVDPYALNAGRRRMATRLIIDGRISKTKWNVIVDENLTNRQAAAKLFGAGKTPKGKKKKQHIQMLSSTGELRLLTRNGKLEMIGHLTYNTKSLEIRHAINKILTECNVEIVP